MMRTILKSKIHRATVTDAQVEYEGSITIDSGLMEAANILPYEEVHVWNLASGDRLTTYAIPAEPNSGTICVNGAAAKRVHKGDTIIISSFASFNEEEIKGFKPRVVLVDADNSIKLK